MASTRATPTWTSLALFLSSSFPPLLLSLRVEGSDWEASEREARCTVLVVDILWSVAQIVDIQFSFFETCCAVVLDLRTSRGVQRIYVLLHLFDCILCHLIKGLLNLLIVQVDISQHISAVITKLLIFKLFHLQKLGVAILK